MITLGVSDLGRAVSFYKDILGWPLSKHSVENAHNLKSEEEVKHFFEVLKGKGVLIAKEPVKADWGGYSGYFKDPDGHLWEVAYNPAFWIGPRSGR